MRFILVLTAVLLLVGCSSTNLAEILKAAGQDQATVSVRVTSIWATIMYCRTAILNGNVACNSDGISVKSDAATVGIPMTVVPQLTIGTPTVAPAPGR